jgi:molecular chaperone GrpE
MKRKIVKSQKKEIEIVKNQLARALADYDNLVKRVEREKDNFEKLANLKLAIRLLPVLDVLRQAQEHLKDPGVAITISQFEEALKSEGIEEIKVRAGDNFDPDYHEAIEVSEVGVGKGKISKVLMSGWRFKSGPVIRHARVEVSKKGN